MCACCISHMYSSTRSATHDKRAHLTHTERVLGAPICCTAPALYTPAHREADECAHLPHCPAGQSIQPIVCVYHNIRYACASDARPHLRARPMPAHSTRISSKLTKRNVRHAHAAHHTHTHSHTQQHTAVVLAEHVVSCVSHASSARPSRLLYIARPHPTDPLNTSAATYSELDMLFGITLFRCVRQRRAQKRALRSPRVR